MGNTVRIPAKGNSMRPLIRPQTNTIELKPLSKNSIRTGNIVLAKISDDQYIVHRIEQVDGQLVRLRGDGNISAREICDKNAIFAEVTAVYKKRGKITKGSFRWYLASICRFCNPLLRRIYLGIDRRLFNKTTNL